MILLTIVLLAVFFAGGNGRIAKAGSSEYFGSKKKLVLEDVLSGKLLPEQRSINWLADGKKERCALTLSLTQIAERHDVSLLFARFAP